MDRKSHPKVTPGADTLPPLFVTNQLKIDCSMIIEDLFGEKRYVWPQRCLSINQQTVVNTSEDFKSLVKEFEVLDRHELTKRVANNHMQQSCFDKSGYLPRCLLSCCFYLSKTELEK